MEPVINASRENFFEKKKFILDVVFLSPLFSFSSKAKTTNCCGYSSLASTENNSHLVSEGENKTKFEKEREKEEKWNTHI